MTLATVIGETREREFVATRGKMASESHQELQCSGKCIPAAEPLISCW